MREIKFRGLTEEGKWVYGWFCSVIDKHYIVVTDGESYVPKESLVLIDIELVAFIEVIPKTIGQFTGLKDNNDKEIYEGDILKGYNCGRIVEWEGIGWNPFEDDVIDAEDSVRYEIIGNIHENPKLLI